VLSVGEDAVFVSSAEGPDGRVVRVPLDGSPAQVIASGLSVPTAVLAVGDDVYTVAANGLFRIPADGSAEPELVVAGGSAGDTALAVDATHLYWTFYNESGGVYRRALDGSGATEVIHQGDSYPSGVVVSNGRVYWKVLSPEGSVRSASVDGTDMSTLASDQFAPHLGLVASEEHIFWLTEDGPPRLMRAPASGGDAEFLGTTQWDEVSYTANLAVKDGYLYYPTVEAFSSCSGIARTPTSGGVAEPIPFDASLGCPMFVAVSGPYLYFTSWAGLSRVVIP